MARTKSTPDQLAEKRRLKAEKETAERKASNLIFNLGQLRQKRLGLPRFQYTVGEEVKSRTACWDKVVILEILDEGKILFVHINYTENNYGKLVPREKTEYVSHLEILPLNHPESSILFNQRRQKPDLISFHNTVLQSLLINHYNGIDYDSEYQRGRVWTQEDKEKLIESIFNRVNIGSFALVRLPFQEGGKAAHYEIIDGKQRLLTIVEFYEDKFSYKGLHFSELATEDKNYFTDYNVAVGYAEEKMTLLQKYDYFLRLNTGGVAQNPEHLEYVRAKIKELTQK